MGNEKTLELEAMGSFEKMEKYNGLLDKLAQLEYENQDVESLDKNEFNEYVEQSRKFTSEINSIAETFTPQEKAAAHLPVPVDELREDAERTGNEDLLHKLDLMEKMRVKHGTEAFSFLENGGMISGQRCLAFEHGTMEPDGNYHMDSCEFHKTEERYNSYNFDEQTVRFIREDSSFSGRDFCYSFRFDELSQEKPVEKQAVQPLKLGTPGGSKQYTCTGKPNFEDAIKRAAERNQKQKTATPQSKSAPKRDDGAR